MLTSVTIFTPYPFAIGEKIHISEGPRHGDWIVADLDDKKITLHCPVSGKEFCWNRFCYMIDTRKQEWPEGEKGKK
ncbi:MAG: hypothetical protein KKB91_04595 [Proteobacteria bacterium]|jgi:hypothetical protein|nr:hypothetical protein [Desulfocapsa sp.]MBU3944203.1 hypothetical protein [Pseudomonadota bacterium]MCG2745236.1 hypothetical protein [Desulfobacteraceae bacterium]MBU3983793.1 hypothetical protein [Pseudomonadota bacterium]MBU4028804.1 hypothetical protein [Pseudomonadota bacterium]